MRFFFCWNYFPRHKSTLGGVQPGKNLPPPALFFLTRAKKFFDFWFWYFFYISHILFLVVGATSKSKQVTSGSDLRMIKKVYTFFLKLNYKIWKQNQKSKIKKICSPLFFFDLHGWEVSFFQVAHPLMELKTKNLTKMWSVDNKPVY